MSGRTSEDILTNARQVLSLVRLAALTSALEERIDHEEEALAWALIDQQVRAVMTDFSELNDAIGNNVLEVRR